MKRKNILWGWAMLIVAMVCCWAFTSCGDDKDEPVQNKLMGVWEYEKNPVVVAQLEQMLIAKLQEGGALTQENMQTLELVKDIIEKGEFVVQLKEEGNEVRLYAYGEKGLGVFVAGTWVMTDKALILQVRDMTLAVTNISIDGNTLNCTLGQLPLSFKKYSK